ncbi:glycerophosphodiester phosphodiesterase [Virgibacillus sp. SK37]|uniref:glycerophosphodiester phosphodiesterase n=1 Tax=Virgibacillus sp. SK37 TaxID=403957 RepID=UPI0004D1490B|nr:glycerophosphodiester phosphodiesterase [Virgibacillus sp. SK37]AIF43503.1 glycerophosphodiester phosphodiesterase [Virgibacillus sp. SK37]
MKTEIYAHRGSSLQAPENTMAAFQLAFQQGAQGIETDVQLTKDNIPVLIHDERVNRTTDGKGYVKDYTFKQLKQLDAGAWFSTEFAGATIPSLEEFLKWIGGKPLTLNIELKNNKIDYKNMETIVYDLLRSYDLLDRTILSTFNPNSVQRLRRISQHLNCALLRSRKKRQLISYAKELGANAIHIKYRLLSKSLVQQCKQQRLHIRVYTVNHPKQILRCLDLDVNGIITDVPNIAISYSRKV